MKLSWEELQRIEGHEAYIRSLSFIQLLRVWVRR